MSEVDPLLVAVEALTKPQRRRQEQEIISRFTTKDDDGSEHTPERCVHAVDGPDWAGLRELYPDGFTGESVGDAADALITDPLLERIHELEAENEKLRGSRNGFKTLWKSACKRSEEWESSWAEMEAERNALQARLDAMTVEDRLVHFSRQTDSHHLKHEQRLVGPWTVVPEGEQP